MTHCGAGCTLGDLGAEWLVFFVPAIAAGLGYGSLFSHRMFAVWIVDYVCAFGFGILFQYFTIVPMRGLSPGRGLIEAVKADALSLTAWQVGMYGFMAFAALFLFDGLLHTAAGIRPSRVLVHDAARHAGRLRHQLSGKLVAAEKEDQGADVDTASSPLPQSRRRHINVRSDRDRAGDYGFLQLSQSADLQASNVCFRVPSKQSARASWDESGMRPIGPHADGRG